MTSGGDCGAGAFDDVVDVEDEGLLEVLEQGQHFVLALPDLELEGLAVVVVGHPDQLPHHELVLALYAPQTVLVLVRCELLQPTEHLPALLHLGLSHDLVTVLDVGQLGDADNAGFELAGHWFATGDDDLHGRPDETADRVQGRPRVLVAEALRVNQSDGVEVGGHAVGSLRYGRLAVKLMGDDCHKVIQKVLLRPVVVKPPVLANPTYIVKAELVPENGLLQPYVCNQSFPHLPLINLLPDPLQILHQWFIDSHVPQLEVVVLQGQQHVPLVHPSFATPHALTHGSQPGAESGPFGKIFTEGVRFP